MLGVDCMFASNWLANGLPPDLHFVQRRPSFLVAGPTHLL